MREIRTLRATWRMLETRSRRILNGHERGNPGYKPRMILRATAPASDPTRPSALPARNVACAPGRWLLQSRAP